MEAGDLGRAPVKRQGPVAHQFIFTMQDVRKVHPPNKEVLKGLWLSFYPGAKIGVLGHNGCGKSTLLRIMAGLDTEHGGEAGAADGTRIGFLQQEPKLTPGFTVQAEVDLAVAATRALVTRFEEIGVKLGEDPPDMDKLLEEYAELQDKIEASGGWEIERLGQAMLPRVPPRRKPPGTFPGPSSASHDARLHRATPSRRTRAAGHLDLLVALALMS